MNGQLHKEILLNFVLNRYESTCNSMLSSFARTGLRAFTNLDMFTRSKWGPRQK